MKYFPEFFIRIFDFRYQRHTFRKDSFGAGPPGIVGVRPCLGWPPIPTPSSWSPGCHSLDQRQIRLGPGPNARGPRRHDAQHLPDAGAFTNQSPCAGADGQRGSLGLATRRGTAPHNPQAPRRAPRWMPAKTRTKPLLDLSSNMSDCRLFLFWLAISERYRNSGNSKMDKLQWQ